MQAPFNTRCLLHTRDTCRPLPIWQGREWFALPSKEGNQSLTKPTRRVVLAGWLVQALSLCDCLFKGSRQIAHKHAMAQMVDDKTAQAGAHKRARPMDGRPTKVEPQQGLNKSLSKGREHQRRCTRTRPWLCLRSDSLLPCV